MSDVAKRLRDRRLNVWEEARKLAEDAAEQNRAFSAEEQGTWDALNEELDKLDSRIKSVLDTEKRAKDADDAFDALSGGRRPARRSDDGGKPPASGYADVNAEVRAFLRGEPGAPRTYEVRHDPNLPPVESRVLQTNAGTTTATVPTDFYDQLIAHLIEVSGVLQAGPTVLRTSGGESLQIPKTLTHSSATSAAQAAAIPTSDPTFGMATLGAYKYGILIQVARELVEDVGVDLLGYLSMQCGRALGNKFGADLVTGSGTSQPTGFMTSATVGVTGTTTGKSGAPQYADLVDLMYSVIAPYRQSRACHWICKDASIGSLRKLVDSTGQPLWQPSLQLGAPDLLLGKPIVADPFMPAVATGATPLAFGDFSQFFVRYVGPVRFERSDDYAFNSDLVTFRALLRGDGVLVDQTGAIKKYQGPTT